MVAELNSVTPQPNQAQQPVQQHHSAQARSSAELPETKPVVTEKREAPSVKTPSPEEMEQFSRFMESAAKHFNKNLQFEVLGDVDRVQIRVIDRETDTVIREIPSTEMINFQIRFRDMLGMLLDKEM